MRQTTLHISSLTALLLFATCLMAAPRLTVVVVVDGLNQSALTTLQPYWQQGGLRTLSEEAYQTTVSFPHLVYGGDETVATLMTGVTPSQHGLMMNNAFSRRDRKPYAVLLDNSEHGISTPDAWSARALLSPTITDIHRMHYGADAHIYAIGIEAETTILLAGHSANACCWLGQPSATESVRWVSTSYYPEGLPTPADAMNVSERFLNLGAKTWTPRIDLSLYNAPTPEEKKSGFQYTTSEVFTHSPSVNTVVVDLALDIQKHYQLGKDNCPDLLLMQMSVLSPRTTTDYLASAEQEDMYLWLNQDLGYLMDQLNYRIGADQYRLLVVGKPRYGILSSRAQLTHMKTTSFNVDRAAALTSTYLMSIYGHERWIDGGYGQSLYLNRTLIEQKNLSLATIQQQVADFLMEFEGVRFACPISQAYLYPELASSISKRFLGDVVFLLQPGCALSISGTEQHGKQIDITLDHVLDQPVSAPLLYWSGTRFTFPQSTLSALDIVKLLY